jgi:O-antigen ligase
LVRRFRLDRTEQQQMKSPLATRTKNDRLDRAINAGLLAAIVFTALAHGTVEPWSVMLFQLILLALIVLWTIKVLRDKRFKLIIPQMAFPVLALIGVGLLQSIALTSSGAERRSLSLDVESTRRTAIVLVFLLISFIIAANFFTSRRRLAALVGLLTTFGLALAVFALVQHFTWNGKLYWFRPNTVSTSAFGPFVNHNHFAGYMELLIPLPVGLIITRAVRGETRLLYGFAAAAMGIALVASLSRGGMLSLAAALVFMILMSARLAKPVVDYRKRDHPGRAFGRGFPGFLGRFTRITAPASRVLIVIAIAGAITAGLIWVGPDPVTRRITEGQTASSNQQQALFSNRAWVWRDTLSMIRANPLLGVGLGAYGTAFSIYTKSDGSIRVPQAHNDYLQVIADCGVVGGLIALWFLFLMFRAIWRGVGARDPLMAGLALGCGASVFGILVHSLFDFNLQLPGTALLFLVLSAVLAQVSATVTTAGSLQVLAPTHLVENHREKGVAAVQAARGMQL